MLNDNDDFTTRELLDEPVKSLVFGETLGPNSRVTNTKPNRLVFSALCSYFTLWLRVAYVVNSRVFLRFVSQTFLVEHRVGNPLCSMELICYRQSSSVVSNFSGRSSKKQDLYYKLMSVSDSSSNLMFRLKDKTLKITRQSGSSRGQYTNNTDKSTQDKIRCLLKIFKPFPTQCKNIKIIMKEVTICSSET